MVEAYKMQKSIELHSTNVQQAVQHQQHIVYQSQQHNSTTSAYDILVKLGTAYADADESIIAKGVLFQITPLALCLYLSNARKNESAEINVIAYSCI